MPCRQWRAGRAPPSRGDNQITVFF